MIKNLRKNKILWLIDAILVSIVSIIGCFNPNIYFNLISDDIMAGVRSQDITTLIIAVIFIFMTFYVHNYNPKIQILILGILGYFFYAYGIYVIERVYNPYYFCYMGIFGISFYSILSAILNLDLDKVNKAHLSKTNKIISVIFLFFISILFNILWIVQLLPLMESHQKIESLYSIFILDMCFIMPSFVITGINILKNKGVGLIFAPVLFVLSFLLLFPVGIGELYKPQYLLEIDISGMIFYLIQSFLFFGLAILDLKNLKIEGN